MGGACGTCGGEDKCLQGVGWENLKERDSWEDPGVDVRIILKEILKKYNRKGWNGFIRLRI